MMTQQSRFNRVLLIGLVGLFLLTLAAFSYANWSAEDPENMQWWILLINIPLLSIPLVLVYGSIYVLVIAWREHTRTGQVTPRLARVIHRAPRLAALVIIGFISLFSLDVFEMQASPLELLGGFLIHNLPSLGLLALLFLAWRRPAVGAVAFLVAAALFAFFFVRSIEALPNLLIFVFPILLVAGLFYADWQWLKPQPHAPTGASG